MTDNPLRFDGFVLRGMKVCIFLLMAIIASPHPALAAGKQGELEQAVDRVSGVRRVLLRQELYWLRGLKKKPGDKALGVVRSHKEPYVFDYQVQSFIALHATRVGPHVLDYLLQLDNPGAVVEDAKRIKNLRNLGNSFAAAVAWEIKRRRKAGEDAKWLEKLLAKLEGDLAEKWVKAIKAAPEGYKAEKPRGKQVQYVAIPRLFATDPGDPVALDLDTGKLVKWPGPEIPRPGTKHMTKAFLEKLKKKVIPTARRQNLVVFDPSFEAMILPSSHWRLMKPGLLQGAYKRQEKFKEPGYLLGGRVQRGSRFVIRLEDGRRMIFQAYLAPDKYGAVIAYAVFGKDENPMRIAPPVDPKTALKRIGKDVGKRAAYLNQQFYQEQLFGKTRRAAVRQLLSDFPKVHDPIDKATAERLRALGELHVVTEAGRLVDWLSAEAPPGAGIHPARAALAQIGTMATPRDRALLGKSVTQRLLEAYEKAESDRVRIRIYKTMADIYPAGLVDYLIESHGLKTLNIKDRLNNNS